MYDSIANDSNSNPTGLFALINLSQVMFANVIA